MKVGVIGLGQMGGGMAKNLIQKGFAPVVRDLRAEAMEQFTREGASSASSAKELGSLCDVVIASLPLSPADPTLENELIGPGGVLEGMGFTVSPPRVRTGEAGHGDHVILVGQLPSGKTATFQIWRDGHVGYDFDGYARRECGKDCEAIRRQLKRICDAQVTQHQRVWKDAPPDTATPWGSFWSTAATCPGRRGHT